MKHTLKRLSHLIAVGVVLTVLGLPISSAHAGWTYTPDSSPTTSSFAYQTPWGPAYWSTDVYGQTAAFVLIGDGLWHRVQKVNDNIFMLGGADHMVDCSTNNCPWRYVIRSPQDGQWYSFSRDEQGHWLRDDFSSADGSLHDNLQNPQY
jgi:hypothetical protein